MKLEIGALTLAGLAFGPKRGRPVLALHGWLDNAISFTRLAPLLDGHRVVALDLPGHGHSSHRAPGAAYHFVDWVPDIVEALDVLGWERPILMGHSMGAAISALVAGAFPERVERLVLLEGLAPMTSEPEETPTRVRDAALERLRHRARKLRPYASRAVAAEQLRKVAPLDESSALLLCERGMKKTSRGWVWRADPRLRGTSPLRLTEAQVMAFMARITCPTLLLRAREGFPFDDALLRARFAPVRQGTLVELEGRHHVHLDEPERVAQVVKPFLSLSLPTELPASKGSVG